MRGAVDDFVAGQAADRELAKKTLETLEAAKKAAMEEVEKATAHGEEKANELRQKIEDNQAALTMISSNHLAHIEKDMMEMNGKQDKVIDLLFNMDKSLAILVDRSERK
jgi:esterase/lipase